MRASRTKTRFAPSPTGFLHIGSARTALFNYLFSKKNKGKFILRIEDTDKERSKEIFEKDIIESLKWLGLDWDQEPYKQSQRKEIYKKYLNKLLKEKKAYYCFCSLEELEAKKQELMSRGLPSRYNGKCARLSEKEAENNLKAKKSFVIRLKIPDEKIIVKDLIRGRIEFDAGLIGDITIAKDLENPLYNFVAAVDDYEMKITHVIRGEDHLPNTPKQIIIQKALGFSHPQYAHLPLILGPDRNKLSKRHGATSVLEYRKEGYLPEALINFLAFLGWNPDTEKEIYSVKNLIEDFSLEKVQKSAAIFNFKRLDYLNGYYIRNKSLDKLTELCVPYLVKEGLIIPEFETQERIPSLTGYFGKEIVQKNFIVKETKEEIGLDYLKRAVSLYQERLKKLSEISELIDFLFIKDLKYNKELLRWKDMTDAELKLSLDKNRESLSKIKSWKEKKIEGVLSSRAQDFASDMGKGQSRGYLLWPLRVALTGKEYSAGPFEIAEFLGKEKTLKRVEEAIKKI